MFYSATFVSEAGFRGVNIYQLDLASDPFRWVLIQQIDLGASGTLGWSGNELVALPNGLFASVRELGDGYKLYGGTGSVIYSFDALDLPTGMAIDRNRIYVVLSRMEDPSEAILKVFSYSNNGDSISYSHEVELAVPGFTRECFASVIDGSVVCPIRYYDSGGYVEIAAFSANTGNKLFATAQLSPETSVTGGGAYRNTLAYNWTPTAASEMHVHTYNNTDGFSARRVVDLWAWCDRFSYVTAGKDYILFYEVCNGVHLFDLDVAHEATIEDAVRELSVPAVGNLIGFYTKDEIVFAPRSPQTDEPEQDSVKVSWDWEPTYDA